MVKYRRELCDLKNPEERGFILELLYFTEVPKDPVIVVAYFEKFGIHSEKDLKEVETADFWLRAYSNWGDSIEKIFGQFPPDVDAVVLRTPGWCYWTDYSKITKPKSRDKPENEKKVFYL